MKIIVIIFFGLLLTSLAFSQTIDERRTTRAEQFGATAGVLIEKYFIDIGKVKGIKIQVMKLKDIHNRTSKAALYFFRDDEPLYKTGYAFLDIDEVDGLIKSMNYIMTTVLTSTRNVDTQITFRSRTGFALSVSYFTDRTKPEWHILFEVEESNYESWVDFNTEDFASMLKLLVKAKTKM